MPDTGSTYWDDRYLRGQTGWDIHQVSPPLQAYFDQLPRKDLAILIPGCGNCYEAEYLLKNGFTDITLLDISPVLMDRLREKFPQAQTQTQAGTNTSALRLVTADLFDHNGRYDLIVEQTFFCALNPEKRPDYVERTAALLKPGGRLAGLLFDRDFQDGPPYGGHKEDYQKLLEKRFRLKTLAPCYNSIKPRMGTELFLIAEKL